MVDTLVDFVGWILSVMAVLLRLLGGGGARRCKGGWRSAASRKRNGLRRQQEQISRTPTFERYDHPAPPSSVVVEVGAGLLSLWLLCLRVICV